MANEKIERIFLKFRNEPSVKIPDMSKGRALSLVYADAIATLIAFKASAEQNLEQAKNDLKDIPLRDARQIAKVAIEKAILRGGAEGAIVNEEAPKLLAGACNQLGAAL